MKLQIYKPPLKATIGFSLEQDEDDINILAHFPDGTKTILAFFKVDEGGKIRMATTRLYDSALDFVMTTEAKEMVVG